MREKISFLDHCGRGELEHGQGGGHVAICFFAKVKPLGGMIIFQQEKSAELYVHYSFYVNTIKHYYAIYLISSSFGDNFEAISEVFYARTWCASCDV